MSEVSRHVIAALYMLGIFGVFTGCDSDTGEDNARSEAISKIERHLQESLGDEVTGIQLGLVHPEWGEIELASGYANLDTEEPMTPSHLNRIASATKLFTAVGIMKLVEDGRLTLDATLAELLPELDIPNDELITVELLLRHRAGLLDHFNQNEEFQTRVLEAPQTSWSPEELVAASLALGGPEADDIDRAFGYTNTAFVLLGLIIESVTSQTYEAFMMSEIVEPAGLEVTVFANRIDELEGYAEGYWFPTPDPVPCSGYDASFVWSAGNIVSTAKELAAFAEALFEAKVLNPSTVDEMRDFEEIGDGTRFGLGLMDVPGVGAGHNGAIFGYTSFVVYDSKQDVAAAVIINSLSDEADPLAIISKALEAL